MKFKQVFLTVAISAVTAFGVMLTYNKYLQNTHTYGGQEAGVIPSNYKLAKQIDNTAIPPGAVDFTQSAAAALPTVVHIKTKTNAKQINNMVSSFFIYFFRKT